MVVYLPDPTDPHRLAGCKCPNCGYDLKGVRNLHCPECGCSFSSAEVRFGTDEPGGDNNPIAFWLIMGPSLFYTTALFVLMCVSAPLWLINLVGAQTLLCWSVPWLVDWLCKLGLIDSVYVDQFLAWTKRLWFR